MYLDNYFLLSGASSGKAIRLKIKLIEKVDETYQTIKNVNAIEMEEKEEEEED